MSSTTSGWYTFEWDFHDEGDDTLAVDLNLYDGTGTWLWTETRNAATDLISTVVGGNRYMWFTFLEVDTLAIDNTTMNRPMVHSPSYVDPAKRLDTFPTGTTTVTITATDDCGNVAESFFDVTVEAETEMVVDLSLLGAVNDPTTRCITFELWDCGVGGPPTIVEEEIDFITAARPPGSPCWCPAATTPVSPPGTSCTPCAGRSTALTVVGTQYVASFINPLIGGNLNDDEWIDILDFGVFNWQWRRRWRGDTNCFTAYPHADIDGDGTVDSDDFTFIQINFLDTHDPNCCGAPAPLGAPDRCLHLGPGPDRPRYG